MEHKQTQIFFASSGDLSEERKEITHILSSVNKLNHNLKIESIMWETDIPSGSYNKKRIQDEINPLLERSDIVIVALYSKLGRFTLEEYELAKSLDKKMFVYFKTGYSPKSTNAVSEFGKVVEFREKIEKENQLLFQEFDNLDQFRNIVKDDLNLYLSKDREIDKTEKPKTSIKNLTIIPAYNNDNIIGRAKLLEKIDKTISTNKEVVLVNGVGGIGKTTLALAYVNAETYAKQYDHIAWINITDNIQENLISQLSNNDTGYSYNPNEDTETNLNHLCEIMRHFEGNNLLVIDNANDPDDILMNKSRIESFGWKTLFTSRSAPDDTTIINVEELEPDDAKELFCRFYKREVDDKLLMQLLKQINYHTLLTELLAKAANKNRGLDIEALVNMVKDEGIKAKRLDIKIPLGKHAEKKDVEKEQKLYSYILAIFDLTTLDEKEKESLRYFSIMPSINIEGKELFDFFQIEQKNETDFYEILDNLVKNGWLQAIESSFKIHSLVQIVARERLKPNAKNCSILINTFGLKLFVEADENPLERQEFIPYAETILSSINDENQGVANVSNNLAEILRGFGSYKKALVYNLKAIDIREKVLPADDPDLATSYNNISLVYIDLSDLENALEYGLKAIDIREKVLSTDHPDLATSYLCIASIYDDLEDYLQAKEYIDKAVGIRKKILPADHPYLEKALGWQKGIYDELGGTIGEG